MSSTIETLQDTVSIITDEQTYNDVGNNNGGNKNMGGKITVESITMVERMHILAMVVEIIYLIAET